MILEKIETYQGAVVLEYRKRRNIGGTFNLAIAILAIELKVAKLKTANILAHARNRQN